MYVRVSSIVHVYMISMACACCVYMHMLCAYKYIHDPCVHSMSGFMTSNVYTACRLTVHWCMASNLEESGLDVTHY